MKLMKTLMGATAALAVSAVGALADGPAIIFDLGGKFDRSFNEAAFNGAQRWAEETGGSSARSSFSPTPSASRRCAALPRRDRTRS
jgi:basic membrane lipoprotein Med (substrate-binding protein (PBP1-ABC) superfamily)